MNISVLTIIINVEHVHLFINKNRVITKTDENKIK